MSFNLGFGMKLGGPVANADAPVTPPLNVVTHLGVPVTHEGQWVVYDG